MVDEQRVFSVPRIDYVTILVVAACMVFFAKGAELEGRSKVAWAGSSLGTWLGFSLLFGGGIAVGLVSQALLFVGLTVVGLLRERTGGNRR